LPALRSGDEAPLGEEGRRIGVEHKKSHRILQGQEDYLLALEEEVRWDGGIAHGQEPQATFGASEEDAHRGRFQNKQLSEEKPGRQFD